MKKPTEAEIKQYEEKAEQAVSRAITTLTMREPWFATAALHLEFRPDWSIFTAATDAQRLYYNPSFIAMLEPESLLFVVCHEVLHCVFLHCLPERLAGRDQKKWNIAADAVINRALVQCGFTPLEGMVPPWPNDEVVETVYSKLPDSMVKQYTMDGDIKEAGYGDKPGDENRMSQQEVRSAWERLAGTAPKELGRQIEEAQAYVDWRVLLAQIVVGVHKAERKNDWSRWHRRLPSQLPGHRRLPRPLVAVCVDTSGSVDGPLLARFLAEVKALTALHNLELALIAADADVHEVFVGEEIKRIASLTGGGGTAFAPAIAESQRLAADLCIYLTDAEGSYPDQPATMPVVWAVYGNATPPWGRILRLQ